MVEQYNLFKFWYEFQVNECSREFDFNNDDYTEEFKRLCEENQVNSECTREQLQNYYNCMEFANNNFSSFR